MIQLKKPALLYYIKLFLITKPIITKIEYIDDIVFEHDNFLEFEGPIISIIQSKKTGELLVSYP